VVKRALELGASALILVHNHFNAAKRWTAVKLGATLGRPGSRAFYAISLIHPGA
jgi:hypothetical protein